MVTTDPGVGLYVDGVYIGRHMGAAPDLLEIERVEVLRGPQGTLFGKNTIGGAINVVTAKPTGETRGHVGGAVGDRYRINVEGSGEVALGDRLAVKASVPSLMRDGVSRQVFTDDDLGDENSFSGRGQLSWMVDASSLYVVVDGQCALRDDPFIDNAFGGLDRRESAVETHSYAGFGQVTFDVTRRFSLIPGLSSRRERIEHGDELLRLADPERRGSRDPGRGVGGRGAPAAIFPSGRHLRLH